MFDRGKFHLILQTEKLGRVPLNRGLLLELPCFVMTYQEFKYLVKSDLYRHEGSRSRRELMQLLWRDPAFRYVFFFRLRAFARSHKGWKYFIYPLVVFYISRLGVRYGICIPQEATVGSGLYIGHWGGIWINREVVIGKNCVLSQNVTLGGISRGAHQGAPLVGDNVYFGPGAVVSGGIVVGDHALIGANSLVTGDVPMGAVMVGNPAKAYATTGSGNFVRYADFEKEAEALN